MKYKFLGTSQSKIPCIGMGTMGIGGYFEPDKRFDSKYEDSILSGIDLGLTFIDTAESYGGGHTEEIIGRALMGKRDKAFIATKVLPQNLSPNNLIRSLHNSLKRLKMDCIDLYQIHWPNRSIPIEETLWAMATLKSEGLIRYIGVCNFSLSELKEAKSVMGRNVDSLQVEYSLFNLRIYWFSSDQELKYI